MSKPRAYMIVGAPRCGSNLLCEALTATSEAGDPDEWYGPSRLHHRLTEWGLAHPESTQRRPKATEWREYRQKLLQETATNGLFGVKVFYYQVQLLMDTGELTDPLDLIPEDALDDLRVIVMKRDDVIAQAVSMAIAHNTGIYVRHPNQPPVSVPTAVAFWESGAGSDESAIGHQSKLESAYSPQNIHRFVTGIEQQYSSWREWLLEKRPETLQVSYEEVTRDREDALDRVFGFLDISCRATDLPGAKLLKQGDSMNAEIARTYLDWRSGIVSPSSVSEPGHQAI